MTQVQEIKAAIRAHGGSVYEGRANIDLLSQGMLMRVSIYGAGLFDRALRFEDLGLSSSETALNEHIRPGTKSYAPHWSSRVKSWSIQCRQAIAKYALHLESVDRITASRSWRFMFLDAYPEFRERWDELMQHRDQIVAEILEEYDDLVEDAVTFYVDHLSSMWDRLQRAYRDSGGVAIRVPESGEIFEPHEKGRYLEWADTHIRTDFPTRDDVRDLRAVYQVNILFDPAALASAQAQEAEARAREEEARDRAWRLATTREERAAAIRQAEMERARQEIAETTSPFREAMGQLLQELEGHIQALLAGLDRNGHFRGRSLQRVSTMADLYRIMGGHNLPDAEIERLLLELKNRADTSPSDTQRDQWTDTIAQGLEELQDRVSAQSAAIDRRDRAQTRAGALEL